MKTIELYDENLEKEISALPYSDKISEDGYGVFIPESDYGFAYIYRIYDDILIFLIPQYGGTSSFHKCFGIHAIKYLVEELKNIC